MRINNYLKLVILDKNKLIDISNSGELKKKSKGVSLLYNSKLNAISGLKNNQTFSKYLLNVFLSKKRDTLIKQLRETQFKAFQQLQVNKRKTYLLLKNNYNYKALRLAKALPIRGQRTHTNAKTARKFSKIM